LARTGGGILWRPPSRTACLTMYYVYPRKHQLHRPWSWQPLFLLVLFLQRIGSTQQVIYRRHSFNKSKKIPTSLISASQLASLGRSFWRSLKRFGWCPVNCRMRFSVVNEFNGVILQSSLLSGPAYQRNGSSWVKWQCKLPSLSG